MHTRGPFCPCPSTAGSGQKHSISFCAPWPRSSLARCQLPGRSVSPPTALHREQEPSPKHWRFVRGGGAEWWVCVAGNAGAGREFEPLVSSVYLEVEMVARPSCRSGGTFMPALTGWGVPCCTRHRAACSMTAMGTQQGLGRAHLPQCACTVLNPPARCRSLGRDMGLTPSHHRGG